jgi:hypothetical protein
VLLQGGITGLRDPFFQIGSQHSSARAIISSTPKPAKPPQVHKTRKGD